MSKGYICLVQNNDGTDYLRLAYGLALSLKNTQSKINKLSIVTDCDNIPEKYVSAFDKIIPLKQDRAKDATWKLHNIVDLYELTPYDETVILDSDMLFLSDVSHWWDTLQKRDLWFTTKIKTYRDEQSPRNTIYRQEFIKNNLPEIYMAFFYFKKCESAEKLFSMAKSICEKWNDAVKIHLRKQKPNVFSTDVAFALAAKLTGSIEESTLYFPYPYFTHMKTANQNWNLSGYVFDEDWTKYIDVSFDEFNNSLGIKLGSLRQFGPLHYHVKEFLTDEMIEILEKNNE